MWDPLLLAFAAGEVYVRRTQSFIVAQQQNQRRLGFVEQNPGLLIRIRLGETADSRAKVVIKNHCSMGGHSGSHQLSRLSRR
jgi:hypothetical protein